MKINLLPLARKCLIGLPPALMNTSDVSLGYAAGFEIPAGKRGKNATLPASLEKRVNRHWRRLVNRAVSVTSICRVKLDHPQLAQQLESWKQDGRDVALLWWTRRSVTGL